MEKKITFKKINELKPIKENGDINQVGKTILLKTIQIKGQDPSNFTLKITTSGIKGSITKNIPLVDYRTKFIIEKETLHVLDVSKIKDFQNYDSNISMEIAIESVEEFNNVDIELFYSLDNPKAPRVSLFAR